MSDEAKKGLRPKEIIWGAVSLAIFAVVFFLVFKMYKGEGEKRAAEYSEIPKTEDNIELTINVTGVDPVKGDIYTRVFFTPHGKFLNAKGFLSENVNLFLNASSGKQEYNFQKGKTMNPVEVTFGLFGQVTDYPLDMHESQIITDAEVPIKSSDKQSADVHQEEDTEEKVPLAINFNAFLHGYKIDAEKDTTIDYPFYGLYVDVSRAGSTKFFSYFIMTAMWLLSTIVVFMVLAVVVRGRKIELGKFAFMSAMIFALPALRNMQPLVPTIGTFSDYVSFFWAEALIALSLFAVVFTWLRRAPQK